MITFLDALLLVDEHKCFRHKKEHFTNHILHIFSYMIADSAAFNDERGREMRGLTFVEHKHNEEPTARYLGIKKFFNLNEREETQYDVLKDKKIKYIQPKYDGSMIMPFLIGDILCYKTIKSAFSLHAHAANNLADNMERYNDFVKYLIKYRKIPYFELLHPDLKIVIHHEKPELRLIQIRDMDTGEICDIQEIIETIEEIQHQDFKIPYAHYINDLTLDDLIELAKTEENIEGWVITFEDGMQIKIKTEWYTRMHKVLTEDISHENTIIQWILTDKFDDAISQIPLTDERRIAAEKLKCDFMKYIVRKSSYLLRRHHEEDGNTRKEVAMRWKYSEWFVLMMKLQDFKEKGVDITIGTVYDLVNGLLLRKLQKLETTRKWLKSKQIRCL